MRPSRGSAPSQRSRCRSLAQMKASPVARATSCVRLFSAAIAPRYGRRAPRARRARAARASAARRGRRSIACRRPASVAHRRHRQPLRDDDVEAARRAPVMPPASHGFVVRRPRSRPSTRSVSNGHDERDVEVARELAREVVASGCPGPPCASRRGRSRRRARARSCRHAREHPVERSPAARSARRRRSDLGQLARRPRAKAGAIARGWRGRRSSSPARPGAAAGAGRHLSAKRSEVVVRRGAPSRRIARS